MKVLIATTNPGKFDEISKELSDLNIEFLNLKQANLDNEDIDEPFPTMKENALRKAEFYAKKSGLPTIAEDTGFFVSYLSGEPGVRAKRFGATPLERNEKIIHSLTGVPADKRGAYFQTDACYFNPQSGEAKYFTGRIDGIIANEIIGNHRDGLSYDCIFIHPENGKAFSEVTVEEKNRISHRGQVIQQIHNYLRQITK
jgi:XTP/dITP diphosphohydrolase